MFFVLSGILPVVLIIIYIFIINFAKIKAYIIWRNQLSKLPTLDGKRFFIGHAGMVIGRSSDEGWKLAREIYKTAPPLHTIHLGPSLVFVGLLEADEIEAVISPMKNLEKSAAAYGFIHNWLEDGLLTTAGKKWQTRRKILTPAFHFSILQGFIETFTRETSKMVKEIKKNYLDKPVDITPIMSTFALLTINETSMGTKLDIKSVEGLSYKNAIYRMGDIIYKRLITPWLHYKFIFDMTAEGRNEKKLVKVLHDFTNNIIQKRAEHFKVFEDQVKENDALDSKIKRPLMDILLNAKFKENSIDDKGIREETNTFMFAGHDTTTMSLLYTCMLLACNREIQDELYQDIIEILGTDLSREPTYADLQDMALMERCIKESLRLYPPVGIIARKLDVDVQTKYGLLPAGTTCLMQLYDLHRNTKYWPNPNKFDPSRHLPENSRGRHPFAYIPFSAGPRNCIGQRFAMLEMKTAICGIIRKFILEPVDTPDTLVLTQDFILRPKGGLKVKFILRN